MPVSSSSVITGQDRSLRHRNPTRQKIVRLTIQGANLLYALIRGPNLKKRNGIGARTNPMSPTRVEAQFIPSCK